MTQKRKTERADASQDSEKFAESGKPEVLSRLERLHAELAKETSDAPSLGGNIRDEFTKLALTRFADLIAEVATNDSLSRKQRIELLAEMQEKAAEQEKSLELKLPDTAPVLWNNRAPDEKNPFKFSHEKYGEAAQFAVISDFSKIDEQLEIALNNYRARHNCADSEYYIPTKKELYASVPRGLTWGNILSKAPPSLRLLLQVYTTRRGPRI